MKFVYNEEKNRKMRDILMMSPTVKEAQALLDKDETDNVHGQREKAFLA